MKHTSESRRRRRRTRRSRRRRRRRSYVWRSFTWSSWEKRVSEGFQELILVWSWIRGLIRVLPGFKIKNIQAKSKEIMLQNFFLWNHWKLQEVYQWTLCPQVCLRHGRWTDNLTTSDSVQSGNSLSAVIMSVSLSFSSLWPKFLPWTFRQGFNVRTQYT